MEGSEVFFPPEIFPVLGAKRRHPVVEVHDEVYQRVDHGVESTEAARGKLNPPPPRVRHQCVVNYVQRRNVVPLFLENEEILNIILDTNLSRSEIFKIKISCLNSRIESVKSTQIGTHTEQEPPE